MINDTAMVCKAPGIFLGQPQPRAQGEHPDEFGFLLDHVQAARSLNRSSFTYYPDPSFEPLGPSGVLDVKPGSHVVLKVVVGQGGLGRERSQVGTWRALADCVLHPRARTWSQQQLALPASTTLCSSEASLAHSPSQTHNSCVTRPAR